MTDSPGALRSSDPSSSSSLDLVRSILAKLEDLVPRRAKALKIAILDVRAVLDSHTESNTSIKDGDFIFIVFKLAFESGNTKLIAVALDGLHQLISNRIITGKSVPDPDVFTVDSTFVNYRLIDVVVQSIYTVGSISDDVVQLQVLKVLLTAVTAPHSEVHEKSLLVAVRACYHIFLSTRNLINRTTARATLTQMINVLFRKMENISEQAIMLASSSIESSSVPSEEFRCETDDVSNQVSVSKTSNCSNNLSVEDSKADDESIKTGVDECLGRGIIRDNTIALIAKPVEADQFTDPIPSLSSVSLENQTVVRRTRVGRKGKFGWCIVCGKTADNYCLETEASVCGVECKKAKFAQALAFEANQNAVDVRKRYQDNAQILQNDAFLLFRALCKLSGKPQPTSSETVAYKSKTLSLELLNSLLANCGSVFRNTQRFIDGVRDNLIGSLLSNCISTDEEIFRLSLGIFVALIKNFKSHLKTEIGVILDSIFLEIGTSRNSSFFQRILVLRVFSKMCGDPQTIIDIFVNYDCDPGSINIFENMIMVLDKITKGRLVSEGWISVSQERQLKVIAVQSIVLILNSLLQWHSSQEQKHDPQELDSKDRIEALLPAPSVNEYSESENSMAAHAFESYDGSSDNRLNITEKFEILKQRKEDLLAGIVKFNIDPKQGLAFLEKNGLLVRSPEHVARFFRQNSTVSKERIGEFLGKDSEFHKQVLYAFVESMDFSDMEIDLAIRKFLSTFRLPGEGQQIDRIMEKFAEHYCQQNPSSFANASIAFILSYSIIMLNTDAHNPGVKHKMTKDDFIKSNQRINREYQLDEKFLERVYDRIVAEEIKLDDSTSQSSGANTFVNLRQRRTNFDKETQDMIKRTQRLMAELRMPVASDYINATTVDSNVLLPMFEICWPAALATFSVLLQETNEETVIQKCLDGYKAAIKFSALFGLHIQRHAFINSLASFTFLGTLKQMKQKNIEAIKLLLMIAYEEGNDLRESWTEVLRCISEFERLRLIGTGAGSDAAVFLKEQNQTDGRSPEPVNDQDSKNSHNLLSEVESSLIDRIFANSAKLNSEAIIDFVEHLCAVSHMELENSQNPRIFSLQKIVEITYYNMSRMRLVWAQIWIILAKHFEESGKHPNKNISMYAIDSLRQLASKFLEKNELANYDFQCQFLSPFEEIVKSQSCEIQEYVVQCLSALVISRIHNVKSGWRTVFSVFSFAASHSTEKLVITAFESVHSILKDYFSLLLESIDQVVHCLINFSKNSITDVSLQAIGYLERSFKVFGSYNQTEEPRFDNLNARGDSHPYSRAVWFVALKGLSELTYDSRIEVRTRSLSVLMNVLRSYGTGFSPLAWRVVFREVLFPIFDKVSDISKQSICEGSSTIQLADMNEKAVTEVDIVSENSWLRTTCVQALETLTELFCQFFPVLEDLLREMLNLYILCMNQPNEDIARSSITCCQRLVHTLRNQFIESHWLCLMESIKVAVVTTLPHELLSNSFLKFIGASETTETASPSEFYHGSNTYSKDVFRLLTEEKKWNVNLDTNSERVSSDNYIPFLVRPTYIRCIVQHLLIDVVADIISENFTKLNASHFSIILSTLLGSIGFARVFDSLGELRTKLWESDLIKEKQSNPPELFFQESHALSVYIEIVYRLYRERESNENLFLETDALRRFVSLVDLLFREYVTLDERACSFSDSDIHIALQSKEAVVCQVLSSLCNFESKDVCLLLSSVLNQILSLTVVQSNEVRRQLLSFMTKHLSALVLSSSSISANVNLIQSDSDPSDNSAHIVSPR